MASSACDCGRNSYDSDKYTSCYDCFEERHEGYLECIFDGRWHGSQFNTCYHCRVVLKRDEAGAEMRRMVITRDHFQCRYCHSEDDLQIDHIKPCAVGGTADPWNLQTLCAECNQSKGKEWSHGSFHGEMRQVSIEAYYTYLWEYLTTDERQRLDAEVEEWLDLPPRQTIATQDTAA